MLSILNENQLVRPDLQAYINSEALIGNVEKLRSLTPDGTKFCAVVKANAYGHGMGEVVSILRDQAVDFFAVASIYEAMYISPLVPFQSIIIFEPLHVAMSKTQVFLCTKHNFHTITAGMDGLMHAANLLKDSDDILKVHINVETGMGRLGADSDDAVEMLKFIDENANLKLAGVYTHFATADEDDLSYAYEQLDNFNMFLNQTDVQSRGDVIVHAANSAATLKLPEAHFDMVRCGISMYGYYSRPQKNPPVELKPVMKLVAPVVHIKRIQANHSVSYGRSFVTNRETLSAVVSFGYSDGYFRAYANKSKVLVDNKVASVMGRVCMDQVLVDVTDIPSVKVGDHVTMLDDNLDSPCNAYTLAEIADTICYEILICVHAHVKRVIV